MKSADVLRILGPLIGSAVGVAIGLIMVRRRHQESPDWQPSPWFRRVFCGLVGVVMLVAGIAGIAAGRPNQWVPALAASLTSFALLWLVEVTVRKRRLREQSPGGCPPDPVGTDEGSKVME